MKTEKIEKSKTERFFVFHLGFRNRGREVAKIGDDFYEMEDLSQLSGKPKKRAKPVVCKPFEKIEKVIL